jgi:uncharacterized protein DUF5107
MVSVREDLTLDGVPLIRFESDHLRADVAPGVGGRVVSLVEKAGGHEFLWRNRGLRLEPMPAGTEYDPNFFGGIDELLPNDIPEEISGVACPDHGELWTLPLTWRCDGARLTLDGTLPRFGLRYERTMSLRDDGPVLEFSYRLTNPTSAPRAFLWKLHAALAITPGDVIECPAREARVVDVNYSRFATLASFAWPLLEGKSVNIIPPADGTMDFFYLFDLRAGRLSWRRPSAGLEFGYEFDPRVFPFAWLFASYGGFLGHYTAVLEPCTAMPISVNEAATKRQCSVLQPGETLATRVTIRAGRLRQESL